MNSSMLRCPRCGEEKPALPHYAGRCVWCAHADGLLNSEELAQHERMGWANGFPTLPHTFREDAINK